MQVWCEFCQNAFVVLTLKPWICRHSKNHDVGFGDPKIDSSHENQNDFFTIKSILFLYIYE